jgi:hypothetical protein
MTLFSSRGKSALCAAALLGCLGLTGCASDYNGQSLPSGNYLGDDIQHFRKGSEFKLPQEAAEMKELRAKELERQRARSS